MRGRYHGWLAALVAVTILPGLPWVWAARGQAGATASPSAGKPTFPLPEDRLRFGAVALSPRTPVEAWTYETFTVAYTVGPAGLADGGRVRVGYAHLITDMDMAQVDRRGEPGYLSVRVERRTSTAVVEASQAVRQLTITWGGPKSKRWGGEATLSAGRIVRVEPIAFRLPQDVVSEQTERRIKWRSTTAANRRHGLALTLDAPAKATLDVELGGERFTIAPARPDTAKPPAGVEVSTSLQPVRFYKGPSHDFYGEWVHVGPPLVAGDQVIFVFGDRTHGSPGTRVQSYDEPEYPFHVEVAPTPDAEFVRFASPTVCLEGSGVDRLKLIAPSHVRLGDTFEVTVRAEDQYYNRVPRYRGTVTLSVDGGIDPPDETGGAVTFSAEDRGVLRCGGWTARRPGLYRFTVRDTDRNLVGRSNPVRVVEAGEPLLLWADLHGHTMWSDGRGSADSFYRFARDEACLDVAAMTDHDIQNFYGIRAMWDDARRAAAAYYCPGQFVTYSAWEWSGATKVGGDHNTFFTRDDQPICPARPVTRLWEHLGRVEADAPGIGVMTIPHVGGRVGNWDFHNERYQRLAEITSDHGIFEWFLEDAFRRGFQVGIVADSDCHQGKPGYSPAGKYFATRGGITGIYAAEATREAVWDALWNRRCFGTTGERIIVRFSMDGRAMGGRYRADGPPEVSGYAAGEGPLLSIDLIRDGRTIYSDPVGLDGADSRTRHLRVMWTDGKQRHGWPQAAGKLTVTGGRITAVEPLHFDSHLESITKQSEQHVAFISVTNRNDHDGLLLTIEGDDKTSLTMERAGRATKTVTCGEIRSGTLNVTLPRADTPTVSFAQIKPDPPLSARVTFTDTTARAAPPAEAAGTSAGQHAAYYYLRVTQIDGELAWSTPIWVEGW